MANDNKVSFGLKNVHWATYTLNELGVPTFDTPVKYPGAVEITNDARGDSTEFFADDTTYYVTTSNQGYEGTFTNAGVPEDFRTKVLGETLVNGLLVEKTTAKIKPVALLFEFDGDVKARRHALLNVSFNRPGFGSRTKETAVEPNTNELSYIAAPLNELTKITTSATTPDDIYNNWYKEVQYEAMITPADQTPLTVEVVPANNATDVELSTAVTFTFNKSIRAENVNDSNFFLTNDADGQVDGSLSANPDYTVITFTPTAPLTSSSTYTAIATKNIKDAGGNSLTSNSVTDFMTGV